MVVVDHKPYHIPFKYRHPIKKSDFITPTYLGDGVGWGGGDPIDGGLGLATTLE